MQRVTRSDTCYSLQLVRSLCPKCAKFRDQKNGQGRAPQEGDIPKCEKIWVQKPKQRSQILQRQQTLQEMNSLNLCFFSEDHEEIESNSHYQIQGPVKSVNALAKSNTRLPSTIHQQICKDSVSGNKHESKPNPKSTLPTNIPLPNYPAQNFFPIILSQTPILLYPIPLSLFLLYPILLSLKAVLSPKVVISPQDVLSPILLLPMLIP